MADTLLDESIKKIEFIFLAGGINIRSGRNVYPSWKSRAVYFFHMVPINFELAGAIAALVQRVMAGNDFLSLTFQAPCSIFCALGNIKSYYLVTNEKNVHKLISKLKDLEEKDKKRQHKDEKDAMVKKERDFVHIVVTGHNWLYMILIILFSISPLLIMIVKYLNSGRVEFVLPFIVLYPFDAFQLKVWPIAYLFEVWATFGFCLYFGASDVFFYTCCSYVRIQFKLLQHDILNLIPVPLNGISILNDEDFKTKFKDTIKWHQDLIECTNILDNIYSKSNLMNFMFSSLIICLSGFNVTMVNNMSVVVIFLTFLSSNLFQIFFLCFFADRLMNSSMEISDAVYQCLWYTTEPKVRKKLLIMQTRAQKPCQMTAFGFADVNLNSFMRILRTAWSFFALLRTLYN